MKWKLYFALALIAALISGCGPQQQSDSVVVKDTADSAASSSAMDARIQQTLALRRVLVIGDSISIGYTPYVQEALPCVKHATGNNRDTNYALAHIDEWLRGEKWGIIHFNWGLWDIAHRVPTATDPWHLDISGPVTTSVTQYQANLRKLIGKMKATGAILVFATTTPIQDGTPGRVASDVDRYNKAALQVMREEGVRVDDLNDWMQPYAAYHLAANNPHWTDGGYELLADKVERSLINLGACR